MQTVAVLDDKPITINADGTWSYLPPKAPALERMQKAEIPASMVELLTGVFDRVGVCIKDTGERVIVAHKGDHFAFLDGSDGAAVDYDLSVNSHQIDLLIKHTEDGYSDPVARFGLVQVFLEALPFSVDSLLNRSVLTNPAFRKLVKAKDLIHLTMASPSPEERPDANFTLFFVNGAWHVAPELIGKPERVFRMSPEEALELMRMGHGATKAGVLDLPGYATQYTKWRNKVEVELD